jgi:uncharacterized protein (DUF433 family)
MSAVEEIKKAIEALSVQEKAVLIHELLARRESEAGTTESLNEETAIYQTSQIGLSEHIVTDHDILGGEPVFRGTRVPIVSLFEHLGSGSSLDEFLENFPSVSRNTAIAVILGAQELTVQRIAR